MKRLISFLVLLLVLNGLASASEVKIGYVDLQRALNESEPGKRAKSEFEALFKTKQRELDNKNRELGKLKEEIEKQSELLSKEALKSKQDEFDRKMREAKRFQQDAEEEINRKRAELTNDILKDLGRIIAKIGKEEGYTLIFQKVEGIIIYANSAIDLTDKVIKRYNEASSRK
jgi:outer membrane protein